MDDLIELQYYIKQKYNINVYLNKSRKINNMEYIKKIEYIYLILFNIILFIIIFIVLFNCYKKNIYKLFKNIIYKYTISIIFIITIIIVIYYIQKYMFMLYLYYNKNKLYENYEVNSKNYKNIDFETGDILQEATNWNYKYGILLYIFPLNFLHNIIVIKFKNKNYGLHFTNNNFGYPNNILSFCKENMNKNGRHIEIFLLDEYINNRYNPVTYYRIFKIKNKLNNDNIFNFLKSLNINNLKFSYIPSSDYNTNKYNCANFLLKMLNYLKIIPNNNYSYFTSDNFIYLPDLSNNMYDIPFMIKTKYYKTSQN
jgi:hypothetical protein